MTRLFIKPCLKKLIFILCRLNNMKTHNWAANSDGFVTADIPAGDNDETFRDIEELSRDQIIRLIGSKFKGHELARLVNGILIAEGQCGSPDPEAGAEWFRRAAEKMDPRAMCLLGEYIKDGKIEPRDGKDADFWFGMAEKVMTPFGNDGNGFASHGGLDILTEEVHQP